MRQRCRRSAWNIKQGITEIKQARSLGKKSTRFSWNSERGAIAGDQHEDPSNWARNAFHQFRSKTRDNILVDKSELEQWEVRSGVCIDGNIAGVLISTKLIIHERVGCKTSYVCTPIYRVYTLARDHVLRSTYTHSAGYGHLHLYTDVLGTEIWRTPRLDSTCDYSIHRPVKSTSARCVP